MPAGPNEPDHPWARSAPLQNHDAAVPIHRVKGFLKIKKDSIEGLQLEVRELLCHFCFNDRFFLYPYEECKNGGSDGHFLLNLWLTLKSMNRLISNYGAPVYSSNG